MESLRLKCWYYISAFRRRSFSEVTNSLFFAVLGELCVLAVKFAVALFFLLKTGSYQRDLESQGFRLH